jgi:hypothetical protein
MEEEDVGKPLVASRGVVRMIASDRPSGGVIRDPSKHRGLARTAHSDRLPLTFLNRAGGAKNIVGATMRGKITGSIRRGGSRPYRPWQQNLILAHRFVLLEELIANELPCPLRFPSKI